MYLSTYKNSKNEGINYNKIEYEGMKYTCYARSLLIPSIMPIKGEKHGNERQRIAINLTYRFLRLTLKVASLARHCRLLLGDGVRTRGL